MAAFRIGAEDAPLIASELGIATSATLTDTANFSAWVKLMRDGIPTDARLIDTVPPDTNGSGRLNAVRNRTRARYARLGTASKRRSAAF